jgi:uncharacterized membrane protein YqaE (UPF0057 family)
MTRLENTPKTVQHLGLCLDHVIMNNDLRERRRSMSLIRVLLAIILPPLAVIDKGCGSILIVALLTAAGWVPGVLAAILIITQRPNEY